MEYTLEEAYGESNIYFFEPEKSISPTELAEAFSDASNYYGRSYVFELDGRYFHAIENYDNSTIAEVSKTFYESFLDEFGD